MQMNWGKIHIIYPEKPERTFSLCARLICEDILLHRTSSQRLGTVTGFWNAHVSTKDYKTCKETGKHGLFREIKFIPTIQPKEIQAWGLLDKDFKTTVLNVLTGLKENIDSKQFLPKLQWLFFKKWKSLSFNSYEFRGTLNSQTTLKKQKKKNSGLSLANFKTYYKL